MRGICDCAGGSRPELLKMLDASILGRINIHVSESNDPLDEALRLLGEVMEIRKINPQHLVVCGGAALRALKIVSRTTRDVDVLAFRGEVDGEINMAWPLCDDLKAAVADVATELKMAKKDWLNASTSFLIGSLEELPSSMWKDLVVKTYGSRLTISFIGRIGLVFLKLRAAVQRDEKRDRDDLVALAPTSAECLQFREFFTTEQQAKFREIVAAVSHGE